MNNRSNSSHEPALFLIVLVAFIAVALYAAVAVPTLISSAVHGEPTLVRFGDAVGAIRFLVTGADGDPRNVPAFRACREAMPPQAAWTALNVGFLTVLVLAAGAALVRVDRWRGARPVGLPRWHPRSWVTSRSWARPRDLRHLRALGRNVELGGEGS